MWQDVRRLPMANPIVKLCSTRLTCRVIAVGIIAAFGLAVAGSSAGQAGSSAAAPNRTEILFLGTAGGPPLRLDRSEPSTLLIVDGRPYLIDCGIGTMRRMLEAGIKSEQIKTIFFTHLHSDHDLGLADVMANDYFRQRAPRSAPSIHIYGPPQTKELVEAAFRYITISVRPFASENPGNRQKIASELLQRLQRAGYACLRKKHLGIVHEHLFGVDGLDCLDCLDCLLHLRLIGVGRPNFILNQEVHPTLVCLFLNF